MTQMRNALPTIKKKHMKEEMVWTVQIDKQKHKWNK